MASYYFSPAKQKAVLLLASGITLALSPSPAVHWRVIKNLPKAWKAIDRTILRRIINEFKNDRLIDFKENKDGLIEVVLTEKGRKTAFKFDPEAIQIKKPTKWDGKWRFVIFDIPEKKKKAREAFRKYLQDLGFYKLQRSVWVYPYECKQEINFLVEFFEVRNHVQYLIVDYCLYDAPMRLHFDL